MGVALRELAEALEAGGQPPVVSKHQRPDGQWVVEVMPKGLLRLANSGFKGSLWIKPGQEPTQGELYRHKAAGEGDVGPGRVALVLGAGNQVSVAALDILHKLVFDDEVVVCKMNPVNENMGPYIARAFAPLVDAGFLAIVYGGGDVGKFLCGHPDVGSIHLTGSAATYDAIVWQGQPKVGHGRLGLGFGAGVWGQARVEGEKGAFQAQQEPSPLPQVLLACGRLHAHGTGSVATGCVALIQQPHTHTHPSSPGRRRWASRRARRRWARSWAA